MNQVNLNSYSCLNQTQPHFSRSDRYKFISTREIVDELVSEGWQVGKVEESRVNRGNLHRLGFQAHSVSLYHPDMENTARKMGLKLFGSHDGLHQTSLSATVLEKVCTNGLIAPVSYGAYTVKHKGHTVREQVRTMLDEVVDNTNKIAERILRYEDTILTLDEQCDFARKAVELRQGVDNKYSIEPKLLLTAHRQLDNVPNLWKTFNRIQENMIKGGFDMTTKDGKRRQAKAVKGMLKDKELNQKLWELADTYIH